MKMENGRIFNHDSRAEMDQVLEFLNLSSSFFFVIPILT